MRAVILEALTPEPLSRMKNFRGNVASNSVDAGIMFGLMLSCRNSVSVKVLVPGAKSTVMELQPYSVRMLSQTTILTLDCGGNAFVIIEFALTFEKLESVSPAFEMITPFNNDFSGYWLYMQTTGTSMMALPSLISFVEKLKTSLYACSMLPRLFLEPAH